MPVIRFGILFRWGVGVPSPPLTRQHARLIVGDSTGVPLAELDAHVSACSWRLNNYGQCEFGVATSDPKCTARNLAFGNRVLLSFENGLPDWGGVIDTPRSWQPGYVGVTAYSAEYILKKRLTAKSEVHTGISPGDIFTNTIELANGIYNTGINIGSVWNGGGSHSITFHYETLFKVIQYHLCERIAEANFDVLASQAADGKIVFTANYYQSKGSTKPGVVFIEGRNIAGNPDFEEQGPVYTVFKALGPGSTWGDERLVGEKQDDTAIAANGYWEAVESHTEAEQQTLLDDIAENQLNVAKNPRIRLALDAQDLAPAPFVSYGIGDVVRVILYSKGFSGYDANVRILTREYYPGTNLCNIVVEEV